jgi:nucleoside-diphosphate-sugar epimerase
VDVRDAARGCILALEADFEGHERFNMAAAGSNMREGTPQLIGRFFPALKEIRNASGANWSGIDSSKAARVLGFRANHVWDKGGGS